MRTTTKRRVVLLGALLGLVAVMSSQRSEAGEWVVRLTFSNMTPDAHSSEASKACAAKLRGALLHSGAEVNYMGETALRKAVGAEDKTKGFMGWTANQVPMSLVAVDCRPEQKMMDVLLVGFGVEQTFRLRDVGISQRRLNWFAKDFVEQAQVLARIH